MAARESWLRSDDHNKFAQAMVKCQHSFGLCGHDGFCHYNGECFATYKADLLKRIEMLEEKIQKLEGKQ